MIQNNINSAKNDTFRPKKILLGLLPFWTPAIPPLGISCLKGHLQKHGFLVTTFDANMESKFREVYDEYFSLVKRDVPENKQGNFFNQGMDAMRNHMMAHINFVDKRKYIELVKIIFAKTFYCDLSEQTIIEMNKTLDGFYLELKNFILDIVSQEHPDVFGLTLFSGTFPASVYAFKIAKEYYPEITTIAGGGIFSDQLALGSPNYEYFLQHTPFLDIVIIGEGENILLKYLQGELDESKRVCTTEDVVNHTLNLADAGLPDFSDFDLRSYPQLSAYTSRSCPFQCSFCSETVHWGNYRKKSPRQIVEELKVLYSTYGRQVFMMGDSLLNPVITGLAEEFAKEDICLYWDGYLRADPPVCDIKNTMKWRNGGFYRARLGVESGSQRVLNLMNKKIAPDQIRMAVKCLAQAGVKTTTYWICGHPDETEEDFQMTLDLIEELQDYLWEAECNPFNYYLTGQVDSDKWMSEYKRITLYPEEAIDMLFSQTWIMKDCEPQRAEIYSRVNRFVEHCRKLGIPNPYSLHEIYDADERWKLLHKNAVPGLVELNESDVYIDDRRNVKTLNLAEAILIDDEDFGFLGKTNLEIR